MSNIIRPEIVKCISFLSVVRQDLDTFESLRKWIIENKAKPNGPGSTRGEHLVPFYTSNALPCVKHFGNGNLFAGKVGHLDDVLGMKLMHGIIATGDWGNNSYSTYLSSDFSRCKKEEDTKKVSISIDDCTVGGKFYFFIERKPNHSGYVQSPQLVVVGLNVRFQNGEIVCLPIQIRTNGCYFGGHAGETKWDITYRKYTKREGWKSKSDWSGDSFRMAKDVDIEMEIHRGIFDKVVKALS